MKNALNKSSNLEHYITEICHLLISLRCPSLTKKGLQLHTHIIKSGLQTIPFVSNNLLNFYSKSQCPLSSLRVFQEDLIKSHAAWTSIISACTHNHLPLKALHLFRQMLRHNFPPCNYTFPSVNKSCADLGRIDFGRSMHSLAVKTRFERELFVGSSMVDMYLNCGEMRDARKFFDEMPEKNVVCWSGMVKGYAQMGDEVEAMKIFKEALLRNCEVNHFTFSNVLSMCGNLAMIELGEEIHALCLKTGFCNQNFVASSSISMYSKCGATQFAYAIFNETKAPIRTLSVWNAMLTACAHNSHSDKAFDLFKQMKGAGVMPDSVTFLCLLHACSHEKMVKVGEYLFQRMKQYYKIQPQEQHYTCIVELLSHAGKLHESLSIINDMHIQPTESVWMALLTGSRIHEDNELGVFAADKVMELGHRQSSAICILSSNAYAAAGRLDKAAEARKMARDRLRERGEKKEIGLSWIKIGKAIHTFASGARSHCKSIEVFEKLYELRRKMEVRDAGECKEEETAAVWTHSERLAAALGLISLAPGKEIMVMTNVRVCGHCHVAFKFMSTWCARVFVLRDNSRFHRFENGKCSCKR